MSDLGPITRRTHWLPLEQRTELCDIAEREFRVKPRARRVKFTHRGERWQAEHSGMRIKVYRANGQPVCCRWG